MIRYFAGEGIRVWVPVRSPPRPVSGATSTSGDSASPSNRPSPTAPGGWCSSPTTSRSGARSGATSGRS
ncbi:hypothetical protein NKG94_10805 [Micromonospora sp. M12]